jgi:type I restriction enzyme M protein
MPGNKLQELENRLWAAADELRANSDLTAQQYSGPVLGLIFLRYADARFSSAQEELEKAGAKSRRRKGVSKTDYHARGVLFLPEEAHFSTLLNLPEGGNLGASVNEAMKAIERENEELKDVLPKTFHRIQNTVLASLLKNFNAIPMDLEGDAFGKIYEYFLGKFAMSEGQRGGEFFTPTSLVKLIVEIIEPFHGRIFDPACGSGGMFVQSAAFVQNHHKAASEEISVYGQERVAETVRLCKMNLAVHGLSGDIRQGNSYYEDLHESTGRFDFVMANPPFKVDKDRFKDDARFPFGMPRVDNANYLWIQYFYSALNERGRAGFVMANSASDARASELEIRKQLIQDGSVDVIVAIGSNFFYTVTLPCTLWFFDRGKPNERKESVLFLDARHIFNQIDRARRDFTSAQTEYLANIVRLYRGEEPEFSHGSEDMLEDHFARLKYNDVAGLCKTVTLDEVELQDWSLNPGRYVGVAQGVEAHDEVFAEKLESLQEELEVLNAEAHELEHAISENVVNILEIC